MKLTVFLIAILLILSAILLIRPKPQNPQVLSAQTSYWLLLQRKSNREFLYLGVPGEADKSQFIRSFQVKTGVPGQKPTPLPSLLGREYWLITNKQPTDNPETAPYFLSLDIPTSTEAPFGPSPYLECDGQCNWQLPGEFGLHGVNGDLSRLGVEDPGSSGCIRHSDEDIAYLYNLLDLTEAIRYYIVDL